MPTHALLALLAIASTSDARADRLEQVRSVQIALIPAREILDTTLNLTQLDAMLERTDFSLTSTAFGDLSSDTILVIRSRFCGGERQRLHEKLADAERTAQNQDVHATFSFVRESIDEACAAPIALTRQKKAFDFVEAARAVERSYMSLERSISRNMMRPTLSNLPIDEDASPSAPAAL
jgi:hypothetical protein